MFGLQFHFNFFFFVFVCLSLNIQSVTLAQYMSPEILQGFHSLGRKVGTVSWEVSPSASSSATQTSSLLHALRPTQPLCSWRDWGDTAREEVGGTDAENSLTALPTHLPPARLPALGCWECSPLPTSGLGRQRTCCQPLSFSPRPFWADPELVTFCSLPQTTGEMPGEAGCLWLPGCQVQWLWSAPHVPPQEQEHHRRPILAQRLLLGRMQEGSAWPTLLSSSWWQAVLCVGSALGPAVFGGMSNCQLCAGKGCSDRMAGGDQGAMSGPQE